MRMTPACPAAIMALEKPLTTPWRTTTGREGRYCMRCGEEIEYLRFHFAQLGVFRCPNCGNRNPRPDFEATDLELDQGITMKVNGIQIRSPYQGFLQRL
ncbi:MAG: hypothetical protein ACOX0Q_06800 [Syntrophomonadaceae bacterium]